MRTNACLDEGRVILQWAFLSSPAAKATLLDGPSSGSGLRLQMLTGKVITSMDIQGQGRVLESRAIKMTEIKHIAVGRQIVCPVFWGNHIFQS